MDRGRLARALRAHRRAFVILAVAALTPVIAATAYATVRLTSGGSFNGSVEPSTAQSAVAAGGGQVTGTRVEAQTYATAPLPTPAQAQSLLEIADENVPAPNRIGQNGGDPGPAVAGPTAISPSTVSADADYKRFKTANLPTASIVGGASYSSFTNEPSVGNNGKQWFVTGNWYAALTHDSGSNWTFLNPFSIFGSGFCCDQVVVYDKTHDQMYWLAQFSDHLVVANSAGTNLSSWCYYNFYPTSIGQASSTALDFNDVMIGTKFLYFTTNIFPTSGYGSEIVRLPLEGMSTCGGISYNYYSQLDSFGWRLVQGSNDRAYWGSDWDPTGSRPNGTSFRLFWWDESSGSIFWNNYTINSFAFYTRSSGQNCGSQDGVVKNWCAYADSRVLGAYRANGVIGFSMNASQGGFATFPYTVREYFRESDLAYLGNSNLYANGFAIQFLALAPNAKGHVGGTYSWGGGTGTTDYYPGSATLVDDDVTPNQPWTNDFYQPGGGNTCTYGGIYRWGDYLTVRPNTAADGTWIGTGFKEAKGSCGVAGNITQPTVVIFGRARDNGDYLRWRK
jgi:hypothetical protein